MKSLRSMHAGLPAKMLLMLFKLSPDLDQITMVERCLFLYGCLFAANDD